MIHRTPWRHAVTAAAATVALAVPVVLTTAGAASAAAGGNVLFRDHVIDRQSHIEQVQHPGEFCPDVPFLVRFDGQISLTDTARTRKNGFDYYSFHATAKNTWTNLETGASFHEQTSFSTRDQKLVFDADGNLVITIMDRIGWKLFDGDGKLVGVDAGLVKIQVVVDINDPADPDDDVDVSDEVFADHGTRQLGERDFCADVMTFLG